MNEKLDTVDINEDNEETIRAALEENARQESAKQAAKTIRKHKREIKRLNDLAGNAVIENNFSSYDYAVRKLRDIYRQPYNDEIILVGWQTTRKQVWEIINVGKEKIQAA